MKSSAARPDRRGLVPVAVTTRLSKATLSYVQVGLLLCAAAVVDRPLGWLGMALTWAALGRAERPRPGRHFAVGQRRPDRATGGGDVGEMIAAYLAWIEHDVAARFETSGT